MPATASPRRLAARLVLPALGLAAVLVPWGIAGLDYPAQPMPAAHSAWTVGGVTTTPATATPPPPPPPPVVPPIPVTVAPQTARMHAGSQVLDCTLTQPSGVYFCPTGRSK